MSYEPSASHIIHSSFGHEVLREVNCLDSKLSPANFMLPIFVTNSNPDAIEPIGALPGVSRYGINKVLDFLGNFYTFFNNISFSSCLLFQYFNEWLFLKFFVFSTKNKTKDYFCFCYMCSNLFARKFF